MTDIPQSAKDAQRQRFLKKKSKRKSTRAAEKKLGTEKMTNPKPLKKAKKVK
jgi:hypothetical protein